MIDILKTSPPSADQWKIAIEGLRDSVDGWNESDSKFCSHETDNNCSYAPDYFDECWCCPLEAECQPMSKLYFRLGERDILQMKKLSGRGALYSDFCSMLTVLATIIAPLYWWKEFDTGVIDSNRVAQLLPSSCYSLGAAVTPEDKRKSFIVYGLHARRQKRTVRLNYEVLVNLYVRHKDSKLTEWQQFCYWVRGLPYSELITGGKTNDKDNLGDPDV